MRIRKRKKHAKKEAEKKEKDKVIEVDTTQEDELVGDAPKKDEAEEKKEDATEEKKEERKPLNDTNPLLDAQLSEGLYGRAVH